MRRACVAGLVMFLALVVATGCDDHQQPSPAGKPDILLARGDLAPLIPSSVTKLDEIPSGTQSYSCSEQRQALTGKGWSFVGRDLRNTEAHWAVDSVVLDNPDADSALQVAQFRNQIDLCNAGHDADLVVFDLGKDRFGYRSVTPDKRVDTVRAYALLGPHRLVQVTVMGLDEHSAPEQIQSLLDKAVQKAS